MNYSHRCPKGNRQMPRVLTQIANAAVKVKGTIFSVVYRRIVPRVGHAQAIDAITTESPVTDNEIWWNGKSRLPWRRVQ